MRAGEAHEIAIQDCSCWRRNLGNRGAGNTAWVGDYKGIPMLFAEREGEAALALACSANVLTVVYLGVAVATRGRLSGEIDP